MRANKSSPLLDLSLFNFCSGTSKDAAKSGYIKGTITSDVQCHFVSNDIRRHRLISVSYMSLLPCHGRRHIDFQIMETPHGLIPRSFIAEVLREGAANIQRGNRINALATHLRGDFCATRSCLLLRHRLLRPARACSLAGTLGSFGCTQALCRLGPAMLLVQYVSLSRMCP
jgi:hypothetical protein